MKNAFLAIIIAILLTYAFGSLFSDWWGIHLMMGDEMLSPFENFAAASAVGVVFVIIGVIVAFSLFGALAIAAVAGVAALLVAGVATFWPFLLVALAVWLVLRTKRPQTA